MRNKKDYHFRNVSKDDIIPGRNYYALRFNVSNSYRYMNPDVYYVTAVEKGNSIRFQIVDPNTKQVRDSYLFSDYYIAEESSCSWRDRYAWWVCETEEDLKETLNTLIEQVVDVLESKIVSLESHKIKT